MYPKHIFYLVWVVFSTFTGQAWNACGCIFKSLKLAFGKSLTASLLDDAFLC